VIADKNDGVPLSQHWESAIQRKPTVKSFAIFRWTTFPSDTIYGKFFTKFFIWLVVLTILKNMSSSMGSG